MSNTRHGPIIVVGSLNVDLVVRAPRAPHPGETLIGNGFARFSGGKGANQAVAAARLGAEVYMVGRVGDDLFGESQLESLQSYGVDTVAVQKTLNMTTGTAVIVVEESTGQNQILIVPGANGCISAADVSQFETLIRTASIVISQLEIPLVAVEQAAKLAKAVGALFILNPAPAQALSSELLALVDVITPNEHEAEQLTGVQVSDISGAKEAAASLMASGVGNVIITLGSRGVYGRSAHDEFVLPAYKVKAVDTVAAGDAFTGALAVTLSQGLSLFEAATFANAAAAVSVTRQGAQSSLPDRAEVLALLNNKPA